MEEREYQDFQELPEQGREAEYQAFPSDFMFQLNKTEFEQLKSDLIFHNGISSCGGTRKGHGDYSSWCNVLP